jgi:hypothetical protein
MKRAAEGLQASFRSRSKQVIHAGELRVDVGRLQHDLGLFVKAAGRFAGKPNVDHEPPCDQVRRPENISGVIECANGRIGPGFTNQLNLRLIDTRAMLLAVPRPDFGEQPVAQDIGRRMLVVGKASGLGPAVRSPVLKQQILPSRS